jgi:hypothetical protein
MCCVSNSATPKAGPHSFAQQSAGRLAGPSEIWQLDAKTRVMLGLQPTKRNQTL